MKLNATSPGSAREHVASPDTAGNARPSFRQVGTKPSGNVLRGAAVPRHHTADTSSRICSIPSKYETVIYKEAIEKNAFGGRTQRFGDTENELPGPGSYYKQPSLVRTVSDSGSVSRLGYSTGFVSKAKRFNDRIKEVVPGPGEYQSLRSDKKPQNKKFGMSSFANTPKSHNSTFGSNQVSSAPGPGEYNVTQVSAALAHNVARSSFTSKTSRGFQPRADVPAPGVYDNPIQLGQSLRGNHSPQSVFKSSAKRMDSSSTFTPGPGAYNAEVAESALRYDWIAKAHSSAVFCRGNTDRFGNAPSKRVAGDSEVGPGYYDPDPVGAQKVGSQSVFKSGTARTGSFGGVHAKKEVPGPAFYHPTSPDKKSYILNGNKKWL
ncbi:TPA: hypothetical protein N0F65_007058 [Lagenidium giganteum]|uniref:Uncharacterized protein n=1 Tax=Lagenidium giganteum TaxID=4803 RepID=A0AAV2YQ56_9STRA|nr:TPA: hypothetical protein N0F65_007058 [Lagenidium giganteum]